MKIGNLFFTLVFAFSACTQSPSQDTATDGLSFGDKENMSALPDTLCFERYSGTRNQDTASVTLILSGDDVTGRYDNIPYEKDSRVGTINGTRSGDTITGNWLYQQEGMMDTLAFAFKLNGDQLLQKPTSFNEGTGREFLGDTASFSLKFTKVDCRSARLSDR